MRISVDWLKQYVDVPWAPLDLAHRLTMVGLEGEEVEDLAAGLDGVIQARVTAVEKHPDANPARQITGTCSRRFPCCKTHPRPARIASE